MIAKLPFGRTKHDSTRTIFGAAAFGSVTQQEADETMETLLRFGVNHIDTAASYGAAEERLGPWMRSHRDSFFLATKTEQRSKAAAREQIHRSLERMQTTQLDLIQLHSLSDEAEWQTAMNEGGALEACIEAREEGLVRFIGVTGHGLEIPQMHLRALARFDFDSVLLPWNFPMSCNEKYADEFRELRALCEQKNVALQTIKAVTRRPKTDDSPQSATWYEPLENQESLDRAVHWLLSFDDAFLNTVGDIHILPRVLDAAARYQTAPAESAMRELVESQQMQPLFA